MLEENLLIAFMAWVQMWVWFFKKRFARGGEAI